MKKWLLTLLVVFVSVGLPAYAQPVPQPPPGGQTTLKIYNSSNNSVQVNVSLNGFNQGNYITDIAAVPFKPVPSITVTSPSSGSFILGAGKAVTVRTVPGTAIEGTVSFKEKNGTILNFRLNTNTAAFGPVDEFTDIQTSSKALESALVRWDFYTAAGSGSWGVQNYENKPDGSVVPVSSASRPGTSSGGTAQMTYKRSIPNQQVPE